MSPCEALVFYTVILFDSTSAKFGTFTVASVNGTLVEDKMRRIKGECAHFSLKKCPLYTHNSTSAKCSAYETVKTLFLAQVCSGKSGGGWDGLPGGEGLGPPGSGSQVNVSSPLTPTASCYPLHPPFPIFESSHNHLHLHPYLFGRFLIPSFRLRHPPIFLSLLIAPSPMASPILCYM